MTNLLAKMEGELNDIGAQKAKIMADPKFSPAKREDELQQLEDKRRAIKQAIEAYIKVQNKFMELMGMFSVNY